SDLSTNESDDTLAVAMLRATDVEGTHPSLSERLAALGVPAQIPESIPVSASEAYFGSRRAQIANEVAEDHLDTSEDYAGLAQALTRAGELASSRTTIECGDSTEQEAGE